ncbi:MAG: Uma2 family endonuclease [Pseudanabaenaceae cyanobacterium bins.68]|nr:Uma2 family endonuclease [Pseudanabaenaceae cyanobacterium bins.68]
MSSSISQDAQISLPCVSWEQFELVESSFAGIAGVKFIYFDGILEIMSPSSEHEDDKSTIGLLLEAYMQMTGIRFYTRGSATLGNKAIGGRKEPDESYNFERKKPIPDLVIEVIITSGSINLLQLYHRLAVPEVWLWKNGILTVYHWHENNYAQERQSYFLPNLDLDMLVKYISYHDQYDAVKDFIKQLKGS